MILNERFDKLTQFLRPYNDIWGHEVLSNYPDYMLPFTKAGMEDWIEELAKFSSEELLELEHTGNSHKIKNKSFQNFLQEIHSLNEIPLHKFNIKNLTLDHFAFLGVRKKKKHELEILSSIIPLLAKKYDLNKVIDIGCGKGHLAHILTNYYKIETVALEQDKILQEKGRKKESRNHKNNGLKTNFVNHTLSHGDSVLSTILTKDSLLFGLHTCGQLSNMLIREGINDNTKAILNIPCCYNRVTVDEIDDFTNISQASRKMPLRFTLHSLTLATRAHAYIPKDNLQFKMRVNNFRYAFHIFLLEQCKHKKFVPLGTTHRKYYQNDFATYAKKQLNKIKCKNIKFTDKHINDFYRSETIQKHLSLMIRGNIIRNLLGRTVELYILMDRALLLEENNHQVTLAQYFDEKISPRNIGIFALKLY